MQNLKVTLVQTDLVWENPQQNLLNLNQKLEGLKGVQDLIVLPEMFTTAFSLENKAFAEEMNGQSVSWLVRKASELNSCITGSILIKENNNYFNRMFWVSPQGIEGTYDKKHLFRFAGEHNVFNPGIKKTIVNCNAWKVLPLVCYDLRFPVWSKNKFKNGEYDYDCIVYVANWPEKRRNAWLALLTARAIENQAYVIGVNRVGRDGKGNNYSGDSVIVDPRGNTVAAIPANTEGMLTFELDITEVTSFREHFPVGLDWDEFEIK